MVDPEFEPRKSDSEAYPLVNTLFYKSIIILNLSFRSQNILNQLRFCYFRCYLQTEIVFYYSSCSHSHMQLNFTLAVEPCED